MRHLWWWLGFAAGGAVLLAAVGWTTLTAVRLERAEQLSRRQTFREENARLALWRMDSLLTTLIAREAARPYAAYSAFYPAERAYSRAFGAVHRGDVIIPSPLLGLIQPEVLLHFQFAPDGRLTSPQVPTGTLRDLALQGFLAGDELARRSTLLTQLAARVGHATLVDALLRAPAPLAETTVERTAFACVPLARQRKATVGNPAQPPAQTGEQPIAQGGQTAPRADPGTRSGNELKARSQTYLNSTSKAQIEENGNPVFPDVQAAEDPPLPLQQALAAASTFPLLDGSIPAIDNLKADYNRVDYNRADSNRVDNNRAGDDKGNESYQPSDFPKPTTLRAEIMRPVWSGDLLLLARRVTIDGRDYVQGCWLDWPLIRRQLLDAVTDLLPAADVRPVPAAAGEQPHQLAALPALLVPGDELPDLPGAKGSALAPTLTAAWICVALAAVAGAALLAGALTLSERRGAFVSAVTHELRTPLTTFRLYAELLAGDMLPDPVERRRCLETLRVEADRLAHLVENVLAFARLERGRSVPGTPTTLAEVLAAARERLADRACQAGLLLHEEHQPEALAAAVRADPQAVERILFNLVDNACKYATSGAVRTVELSSIRHSDHVALRVRDHGPGLPADLARRLFVPFAKSAAEAARTAPGVGLGLALSHRLARQLGGSLALDRTIADGACFVLILPVAAAAGDA